MTDHTMQQRLAQLEADVAALRGAGAPRAPGRRWGPMRTWRRLATILSALLLLSLPLAVSASDRFADVPADAFYHDAAGAIADAGITAGCGGANYCPELEVTRGQMAAFLHRGLGRVARAQGTTDNAPHLDFGSVVADSITVGGTGAGANQFVVVHGQVTIAGNSTACPCYVNLRLRDTAVGGETSPIVFHSFDHADKATYDQDTFTAMWVFTAPAGSTRTYSLDVSVAQATSGFQVFNPVLIAMTSPFGATGGTSLGVDEVPATELTDAGTPRVAPGD